MNGLSFTTPTSRSTYSQTDNSMNISYNNQGKQSNSNSTISTTNVKKENLNETLNCRKTLFISGLRSNVKANDIYRHFTGCIKVTFKTCKTAPHLKYAFVVHRTSRHAEYNLSRPINHMFFGSECRIDYANDRIPRPLKCQYYSKNKIVVKKIPTDVSENDLQHLFGSECHILNYYPARYVRRISTVTTIPDQIKILTGYAFIRFNIDQQAANVVNQADQYKINGRSLHISFFYDTKPSETTAK